MNKILKRCKLFLLSFMFWYGLASTAGAMNLDDGRWTFNFGGGYTPFVGGMGTQLTDGWTFQMGTGYEFDDKLGLLLEFGNFHGGIEDGILNRYSALAGGDHMDGYTNIWSLTLNPKWNFKVNHIVGGYLIGGGGYYHVNAQITTPSAAFVPGYCDPWWGCWPGGFVPADRLIAERKDDTGGLDAGLGFTFNFWHEVQFYVETRYHYILVHGPDLQLLPFTAGFKF